MRKNWLYFLLLLLPMISVAQTQLFSDENIPYQYRPDLPPKNTIRATPKTLPISSIEPFFDDFSTNGQVLDTNKWYFDGSLSQPTKSRHAAKDAPTIGVVSFDGLNAENTPYESASFLSGTADVLETHYLDLSTKTAADSIYLSFFLQPQGYSEKPEAQDSFVVYFRANSGQYQRVYYQTGTPVQNFKQIILPITQSSYFHNQFQVKFKSVGALYGHLDVWHIDYVRLAVNRTKVDTTYNDVAISDYNRSILSPYTAVPFQQYEGKNLFSTFDVKVSNLKNQSVIPDVKALITDPVGNNTFVSGNSFTYNLPMTASSMATQAVDAFTNQVMAPYTASYQMRLSLPPDIDGVTSNNRIYELYRIDSLYAYDDGEMDGSYGIVDAPKGFGNKFTVTSPDSIVAVWIAFAPRLNGNSQQIVYMDDHNFRLTIWDGPNPNAIAHQQILGSKVHYGDSANYFYRYPLNRPVSVNGDIWVGVEQTDYWALGVGLDLNYDNKDKIYWDSVGFWVQEKNIRGSLMIRPEFQNVNYHAIVANETAQNLENMVSIYPNPSQEKELNIRFSANQVAQYQLKIFDLQGKEIYQFQNPQLNETQLKILLPDIISGMYILRHEWKLQNGETRQKTEKWVYGG